MSGVRGEATPERGLREDVVRRLIGREPTAEELQAAAAYGDLRWALRAAREDAGLSQTEIAARMALGQSEVSRLESSVGPITRLGRIRNYLAACGADMRVVVTTASGRELHSPATPAGAIPAPKRDALYDAILALDRTLDQTTRGRLITPEQAGRLRESFLRHLLGTPEARGGAPEGRETVAAPAAPAGMPG